jgi:hypothetical protein
MGFGKPSSGVFEMEKLRIIGFGPGIFLISFLVGHQ